MSLFRALVSLLAISIWPLAGCAKEHAASTSDRLAAAAFINGALMALEEFHPRGPGEDRVQAVVIRALNRTPHDSPLRPAMEEALRQVHAMEVE